MADYWKSAGNYLCKLCDTFVRNTKFERNRHENSQRHQNAVQRQLREAHKQKDRDEREKKKVQAEIARLNKTVGGPASPPPKPVVDSEHLPWKRKAHTFANEPSRQATAEDYRTQAEQLAQLGVEVPDEYRGTAAAAPGEWQVVGVSQVDDLKGEEDAVELEGRATGVSRVKKEESGDEQDVSKVPEDLSNFHNRKKEKPAKRKKRPDQLAEDDLDDLFGGVGKKPKKEAQEDDSAPKLEEHDGDTDNAVPEKKNRAFNRLGGTSVPVVFKKRKAAGAAAMNVLG